MLYVKRSNSKLSNLINLNIFKVILYVNKKLSSIYSNVITCFILTPFLTLPSQPLLPSPLKLQNFTTPNEPLMSVCCVQIWHIFHVHVESIASKLFFYELAELSSILLDFVQRKNFLYEIALKLIYKVTAKAKRKWGRAAPVRGSTTCLVYIFQWKWA